MVRAANSAGSDKAVVVFDLREGGEAEREEGGGGQVGRNYNNM